MADGDQESNTAARDRQHERGLQAFHVGRQDPRKLRLRESGPEVVGTGSKDKRGVDAGGCRGQSAKQPVLEDGLRGLRDESTAEGLEDWGGMLEMCGGRTPEWFALTENNGCGDGDVFGRCDPLGYDYRDVEAEAFPDTDNDLVSDPGRAGGVDLESR